MHISALQLQLRALWALRVMRVFTLDASSKGCVSDCVYNTYNVPPAKLNKLVQYEISSSAVQANSSHAWVHKCMGAQKKGKRVPALPLSLFHTG